MMVPKQYLETYNKEAVGSNGVIVTNQPLASSAGIEAMAHGGNAFDAAIAGLFALSVVEPLMVSIFGAGFFVYRDAETGEIKTLDNYAVAPKAATETMYTPVKERKPGQYLFETEGRKNMVGYLSVATPGTLKAWEHIQKTHGALSLQEVMAPAIRLASSGYRASPLLAHHVKVNQQDLSQFPATAEIFLLNGKLLQPGQRVMMPEYAETLRNVSEKGSDILYEGELGKTIVDDIAENGGILTMDDLRSYRLYEKEPVHGSYHDIYEVYSMPPGSSGGTHIIQILNILEHWNIGEMGFGSTDHIHHFTEALKIAFADRQQYMGDPWKVSVPVKGLISKKYAAERAKEITSKARYHSYGDPVPFESQNTTHLSAADSEGNMVAATQTLFNLFGSKVMVPGTGVFLNNCMGLFDPNPGRANSVGGGKRMLSSMAPTIVLKKGEPFMCLGTPGGTRIFPSVCQALINVMDFKMTLQQAVEAPRAWTMGIKGTPEGKLFMEPDFPDATLTGLGEKGHEVEELPQIAGGMNGVIIDETGMLHGSACWRADGTPMGYSGGRVHPKGLVEFKV